MFTFLVSVFMAFLTQKLIYTTNIWFKFVFGSFCEQDHLLNLRKNDLNVHIFQYKNWCSPKSDQWFFFPTLTVRGPFHRKDFKWKKNWGYGITFSKTEALHAQPNERAEAATSSYSAAAGFFTINLFCACG